MNRLFVVASLAFTAVLGIGAAPVSAQVVSYRANRLNASGLGLAQINNRGEMIGGVNENGVYIQIDRGLYGTPGEYLALTLPGWDATGVTSVFGINDSGAIVGSARRLSGNDPIARSHAFMLTPPLDSDYDGMYSWDEWVYGYGSRMIDLGTGSFASSHALRVNASGVVVGYLQEDYPNSGAHGFVWRDANGNGVSEPGDMIELDPANDSGMSMATAINDAGQVTGVWSDSVSAFLITPRDSDGDGKPDTWYEDRDGDGQNDLMRIVALGFPTDLNAAGQVITSSGTTSILWDPLLGPQQIGAISYGLNNQGEVVGSVGMPYPNASIWRNGVLTDLNTMTMFAQSGEQVGVHLDAALDINDAGQIVAEGTTPQGGIENYLLNPVTAEQASAEIAEEVAGLIESGALNARDGAVLQNTIDAAVQRFNSDKTQAGVNILHAFNNRTNALVNSRRLSVEQGQSLVDASNAIIDALSG